MKRRHSERGAVLMVALALLSLLAALMIVTFQMVTQARGQGQAQLRQESVQACHDMMLAQSLATLASKPAAPAFPIHQKGIWDSLTWEYTLSMQSATRLHLSAICVLPNRKESRQEAVISHESSGTGKRWIPTEILHPTIHRTQESPLSPLQE